MVVRYVGQLVDVDRSNLASDAHEMIAYINDISSNERASFFDRTTHVDVPPIDWDKARGRGFELDILERALYHQSEWLIQLAARLLVGATTAAELEPIVERVLSKGQNSALWIAAPLAHTLPANVCERLARAALRCSIRPGSEHLFELLAKLDPPADDDLLSIIQSGLNAKRARTATAAAKLAKTVARAGMDQLSSMLRSAYQHWQVTEEPYPVDGGVIPDSPREWIIKALLKSSVLTDDELFEMVNDRRSDVQTAVTAEILSRTRTVEVFRKSLLAKTESAAIPNRLLIDALREKQPFSMEEIDMILRMTGSGNPKVRYATFGIFDPIYLGADVISEYLAALAKDSETEIRSRAIAIQRGKPT
jgi:hypothetical protein